MSNKNEAYEKLVRLALPKRPYQLQVLKSQHRETLALETEAWVNTLSGEDQNTLIVWFGGKVARKDVPNLIRKSPKFAKFWAETLQGYYNEYLSGGAK